VNRKKSAFGRMSAETNNISTLYGGLMERLAEVRKAADDFTKI
jgi:hypothetical protein